MSEIGSAHFDYMTLTFYSQNIKCADITRHAKYVNQIDTPDVTIYNLFLQMEIVVQSSLHIMCLFTCDATAVKKKFHDGNKLILGAI